MPENSQFRIKADELKLNNSLIISEQLCAKMTQKNISLFIDVFDSDESNPDKPVLVFIHGNSLSKKIFNKEIDYYDQNYRVIALDLLGHGESTKIGELESLNSDEKEAFAEAFFNPSAMIAEVVQLLETKMIKQAHIIGFSLGGHIAYGVAIENPSLVSSLITIGSPPVRFSIQGFLKGFNEFFINTLIPFWVKNPKKYLFEQAREMIIPFGFKEEDNFAIEDLVKSDPLMRKNLFKNLADYDNTKYLNTVLDAESFLQNSTLPVCLIVGDKDIGINVDYMNSLKDKLKKSELKVKIIKDAPHLVFGHHNQEFLEVVDAFLLLATANSVGVSEVKRRRSNPS